MRDRHYAIAFILFLLALLVGVMPVCASTESAPRDSVPDLVIVPFANNTGQGQARALLMPRLEKLLRERNLSLVSSAELRPLLRDHRVRSRGWIGKRGAQLVGDKTGTRHLLLGSWDVLKIDGNLEIGLSLRILDLDLMALTSAVSVGITGEDSVGWLDLGREKDLGVLATIVLEQAVEALLGAGPYLKVPLSARGCNHVAVIPLDNYSATEFAGEIVTNILLSRLVAGGYFVVEPGFVREIGLAREVLNRGGVDRGSAQDILDSLGACQVITGDVQRFDPQRGLPTNSVPRFAAGLRASSTRNGSLYIMREIEGTGSDGEVFFQLGREHSITELAAEKMDRFIIDLMKANRKDIIYGPKDR